LKIAILLNSGQLKTIFFHYICRLDAGEDALRSEDVGLDAFSRLDAQKECLIGPVRCTIEQQINKNEDLQLYTLGEETYHKANVAIIVTSRGRASVALPPTCSAIDFYSCLRDLSSSTTTTGGETNFPSALGLASLLARKAVSSRIIAFVAGSSLSPSSHPSRDGSSNNKDAADSLAVTMSARVESLPFKGSELTLVSLASPLELGSATVHALESSVGKEKITWGHLMNKNHGEQNAGGGSLTQFWMEFKLSIGDEAGIPSFIASKSVPEQQKLVIDQEATPSVPATATATATATTANKKVNFKKSGPLQRSSFTCRDSCLDVLLHHSRSGLLRGKMPTYSTLASKVDQKAANGSSSGSGGRALLSTPHGCYIRIMPQPYSHFKVRYY
jgi:hypothetical protein